MKTIDGATRNHQSTIFHQRPHTLTMTSPWLYFVGFPVQQCRSFMGCNLVLQCPLCRYRRSFSLCNLREEVQKKNHLFDDDDFRYGQW